MQTRRLIEAILRLLALRGQSGIDLVYYGPDSINSITPSIVVLLHREEQPQEHCTCTLLPCDPMRSHNDVNPAY